MCFLTILKSIFGATENSLIHYPTLHALTMYHIVDGCCLILAHPNRYIWACIGAVLAGKDKMETIGHIFENQNPHPRIFLM